MSLFTPDFYVLNTARHFSFPHSDCDELSDNELIAWFYKPDYYCFHILKYYKHDATYKDLCGVQSSFLTLCGVSWMRLKFVAEVMDPVRVTRRIAHDMSKPSFIQYRSWKTEATSRAHDVDILANYLLARIIHTIECHVRNVEPRIFEDAAMIAGLQTMNSMIHTIRKTPCRGVFMWSGTNPHDLVLSPYLDFITRLWEAIHPVVLLCDP